MTPRFSNPFHSVIRFGQQKFLHLVSMGCLMGLGGSPIVLKPQPVWAAEAVKVSYGLLEFSISLDSLQTFVESGKITGDLQLYAKSVDKQNLAELRQLLQQKFEYSPVLVSQLTYSPIGAGVLQGLGSIIRTDTHQEGFYALRAALLLAASDREGLTTLNIIRRFPSANIRINLLQLLRFRRQVGGLVAYRDAALKAIAQQMQTEIASGSVVDFSKLPHLEEPGSFQFSYRRFQMNRDRQTLQGMQVDRRFIVDLYLPQGVSQPAPVVVVSHGMGSSPDAFAYLGKHLASHGFVAVVPQHLGSDATRQQGLLKGIVSSNVNPVDFLDRPLDIKYVLDQLEQMSQTDPTLKGKMNLQDVGAIGHSFGGYTVLALAGADPNNERLRQDCPTLAPGLNAAPTLECLATRLPPFNYHLRDPRIKAVFAISPITSVVLGPENLSKIQIPTMLMGGSNDFIASVVQEQIHPFIWLTTPEKYLAISISSGHSYADATGGDLDPAPGTLDQLLSGPSPRQARNYVRALSLAFMQTYLANRPEYKVYLSPGYAQFVSQKSPLQLDLVRSLTSGQLKQAFGKTPPIPIVPPLASKPTPQRSQPILQEIARTGVLRVGIRQDAAPFGFKSANGQPTGFCVDVLNALSTQLQQQLNKPVRLEVITSTLENRFQVVQNHTVHLECGPNTIRNNLSGVAFSTPFFLTGAHFLIRSSEKSRVNPLTDLSGIRVGVVEGSTTETFVRQRYPRTKIINFRGAMGRSQGIKALASGNIDAFVSDGILLRAEATKQNLKLDDYPLTPKGPLSCDPYSMILPENDLQWQDTVNNFIDSPAFKLIWSKWFTQNAYSYIFLNLDYCAR